MAPTINAWMYEKYITRVKDVYGHFYYIATRHLNNPDKIMLEICTHRGLRRTHTQAGRDGMNVLHRENIAEVRETKLSFHFELDDIDPYETKPAPTQPAYPMVAGEGAAQFSFDVPADTQLALF
jgi:hypothetical protein